MNLMPSPVVKDAVRVKVIQHSTDKADSQCCRFSIDPELTNFEVLQNLITRAFDLKGEFQTCYLARDERLPEACWLPLLSDFDFELALLKSSDPYLLIKVDLNKTGNSWDVTPFDISKLTLPEFPKNTYPSRLPWLFKEKMEKTLNMVQKALTWPEDDDVKTVHAPLNDATFQGLLDPVGCLLHPKKLRLQVYLGGVEPSLRKVVWKHLLNVYRDGLNGRERIEYMKKKTLEYEALRQVWKDHLQQQNVSDEVLYITNMVRKDVLRTDRQHHFYSGPDDNPNIQSLFNILSTYALNHPSVGYCQGMSDLASPLLVTMKDEAQAYVCFCALLQRLHSNFHIDGDAMTLKFQHLTEGLIFYDPEFFAYLQLHRADDLLFCYRWLLLELKREFAFDDALIMLEVLWSSLPPDPPKEAIPLFEVQFNPVEVQKVSSLPPTPRQSQYANVCALRWQNSCSSIDRSTESLNKLVHSKFLKGDGNHPERRMLNRTLSQPIQSLNLNSQVEESPQSTPTKSGRRIYNLKEFQQLAKSAKQKVRKSSPFRAKPSNRGTQPAVSRRCFSDSDTNVCSTFYDGDIALYDGGDVDVWQNPVASLSPDDDKLEVVCESEESVKATDTVESENGVLDTSPDGTSASLCSSEDTTDHNWLVTVSGTPEVPCLPPVDEFGGGNPFLMILCLTLLLQHRQHVMQHNYDHNELAMYFDKLVRQHNVKRVLSQARRMFDSYLKLDFSKYKSRASTPGSVSNGESC